MDSIETRACTKCGVEFPRTVEHFARHKYSSDGMRSWCRPCHRADSRRDRAENLEARRAAGRKAAKEKYEDRKGYFKEWRDQNAEHLKEYHQRRYEENREKILIQTKQYHQANPEIRRKSSRNYNRKIRQNPVTRLNERMRSAIGRAMRGDKAGRKWESIVGYTKDDLAAHIERQFTDGMSWKNVGDWHIDHIVPLSAFNDDDWLDAWALTNLRPLWAKENWSKNNRRTHLL